MKTALLLLGGIGIGIVVGWYVAHPSASAAIQPSVTASPSPKPVTKVMASAPTPSVFIPDGSNVIDWKKIHVARDHALQVNPDLKKEYDGLIEEMAQQQQQLDAAMLKIDPTVAPILKKINSERIAATTSK